MGKHGSLCLRTVALCLAGVLALNWHQADCSSVPHQRKVHVESVTGAKHDRLYAPPPLPDSRRNVALQHFEKVHPTLTIHYNGFSRRGSLICYDMLNELRTVDEARNLMDVEFHLLDIMLEHYKVRRHMRIIDANVVKEMLKIGNLFSFKFPEVISNVTRFIKEYDPILRVFLKRYLPHIELLVLVNVPGFLAPFIPTMAARIMGIPSEKIVAISSGSELERFMEMKYVPKEFGNPTGFSVKNNREELMAYCLMLQEIKEHLGESALTEEGKKLLERYGPTLFASQPQTSTEATSSTTVDVKVEEIEEELFDDIE